MAEVFAYGEVGIDNIIRVPHLPTLELAAFPTSDTYHIGGAAANTAVTLAAWGVRVRLAGNAIGDDERDLEAGTAAGCPTFLVSPACPLPECIHQHVPLKGGPLNYELTGSRHRP